jgi:Domain of unknown function (DUF4873)
VEAHRVPVSDYDVVELTGAPQSAVFDEATHTWTLTTESGETRTARIVIADAPPPNRDWARPYLGVALHGLPNYFLAGSVEQDHYVKDCLKLMARNGYTRIEVRYSTERLFNERGHTTRDDARYWRRMRKKIRSAFDLSSHIGIEDDVYDGPAVIRVGDDAHSVRVRLTGHVEPIDGRYHWQGTVFETLPEEVLKQSRVRVTVGEHTADARITERTPWGSYSVAGVGAPPFALDDVEIAAP